MKKQTMPTGFSGFAWGLAAFCLPNFTVAYGFFAFHGFCEKPYTERFSDRSFLDYLLDVSLCFSFDCTFAL